MGTPNWGRLFQEGRCKAIGIAWSDIELEAIKDWVNPKDIQTGSWKQKEKEEVKDGFIINNENAEKVIGDTIEKLSEKKEEVKEEKKEIPGDIKQIMKQMRQTLREKWVGFSNADSLEKLQERLSKVI